MIENYNNEEWLAAMGEGLTSLVLLLVTVKLVAYKYSREKSKNKLTLIPLYACLALVLMLSVLELMDLICSDHKDHSNRRNNVTHKVKRFFELIVACLGCFVTAI